MTKKEWLQKDLLEGLEQLSKKVLPDQNQDFVKNCLGESLKAIEQKPENEIELVFLENLEQDVTAELLGSPGLKNLPEAKKDLVREELEVIFKALDYKYTGEEPQATMHEDFEACNEPEGIEPWWKKHDCKK